MGELYYHFSHDHPLHLVKPPTKNPPICSCCKLSVLPNKTLDFYTCKTCDFSLHRSCFRFPDKIRHLSHPNHALSLVSTPASSICRACGEQVNGFHYHCGVCSTTSYHVLCSYLPQSVSVTSHPHPLKLEFSLPYDFCCDLCQKPGLNTMWLYRCGPCEFDAHLNCTFLRSISKSAPAGGGEEIMQLISQKMETRVLARRSSFPEENLHIEDGRVCMTPESHRTNKPDPISDKSSSSLISLELTPTQSYQFSDSYFSIDLANSYPSLTPIGTTKQDQKDQENMKVGSNKATLVGINENVFLDWGEPLSKKSLIEMDQRSKSVTKGSSFTSSGAVSANINKIDMYMPIDNAKGTNA